MNKATLRTGKDSNLKITRVMLRKPAAISAFLPMFVLSLCVGQDARCYAQAQTQPDAPTKVAVLREPLPAETSSANSTALASAQPSAKPDPEISLDIAKELAVMKARIEQLEAQLKNRTAATPMAIDAAEPAPSAVVTPKASGSLSATASTDASQEARTGLPEKPAPTVPFAYADWTWLNGTPRNKDAVWDSKFFTPEIRFDTDYVIDYNHPRDDTLGGSTEIFRSNEIQVEQISFGGDFHWQDVRGRVLTMNGMFGVTTPRNDASAGRGQWIFAALTSMSRRPMAATTGI